MAKWRRDVFDLKSLQILRRIPVADDADAILKVANGDANLATLIDPIGKSVVGTIASLHIVGQHTRSR